MKCKHKWVDMEDGTDDQICVRCRKFQMQGKLTCVPRVPDISVKINNFNEIINAEPMTIETLAGKIQREIAMGTRARSNY